MTQSDKDLLLQDLSARLPYKMKFKSPIGILEMNELNMMSTYPVWANTSSRKENPDFNHQALKQEKCSGRGFKLSEIKPILYPLSSITQFTMIDGKELRLIDNLASIFNFDGYAGYYTTYNIDDNEKNVTFFTWGGEICRMDLKTFMVTPLKDTQNSTVLGLNHFQEVFSLFNRYHIDYRGLIEKGLAVSVHSLEENPYV